MNKTLDFLEKHVQWLALGLGALYVVWILTSNTDPPTLVVNKQPVSAIEADRQLQSRTTALETQMRSDEVPELTIQDYSSRFEKNFKEPVKPVSLAGAKLVNSIPPELRIDQENAQQVPLGNANPIARLPDPIPAPQVRNMTHGRSQVLLSKQGEPEKKADRDWVTVYFSIPAAGIARAFNEVGVPPLAYPTTVVRVELIRQELREDGQWSEETVVPPLQIHAHVPPFPGNNGNQIAQDMALNWAIGNSKVVQTPPFYNVQAGDQWTPQGAQRPVAQPAPAPAARRQAPPPAAGPAPGGGPPGNIGDMIQQMMRGGGGRRAPRDGPPSGFGNGGVPDFLRDVIEQRMRETERNNRRQKAAQGPLQADGVLVEGMFDPRKVQVLEGWAHDDTVQPGKTYRYKLRYMIKNPVYKSRGLVAKPELAQQFVLISQDSAWTTPRQIPDRVTFFLVGGIPPDRSSNSARVEIFWFKDGQWHMQEQNIAAGDLVRPSAAGFDRNWTVVDLQVNPVTLDTEALFVGVDGNIVLRDYATDHKHPLRKDLREQVSAARAANALGAAQ